MLEHLQPRKLFEKHYVDVRRATAKYQHIYIAFAKELAKQLFKPIDVKELQDHEI